MTTRLKASFAGPLAAGRAGRPRRRSTAVVGLLLTVGFFAFGVFAFSIGQGTLLTPLILFGGIAVGVGVAIVVPNLRKRTRQRRMDEALLTTGVPLRPGDRFTVRYRQRFNQEAHITALTVSLIQREWVKYTAGTETTTETHDHMVQRHALPARRVEAGSSITETLAFTLPGRCMHTWAADALDQVETSDPRSVAETMVQNPTWTSSILHQTVLEGAGMLHYNAITWHVHIKVAFRRWPSYQQAFYLLVSPDVDVNIEAS